MENFFTESNLTALREMALRHTAHEVEEKLDAEDAAAAVLAESPGEPAAGAQTPRRRERILLCLTGRPSSAILIRRGKRVADYIHADCLAVHVGDPSHDGEAVERHMSFARNLRIDTHVIEGGDVPGAIAALTVSLRFSWDDRRLCPGGSAIARRLCNSWFARRATCKLPSWRKGGNS
jgi:two-component system sensor histidine kinase KdpD